MFDFMFYTQEKWLIYIIEISLMSLQVSKSKVIRKQSSDVISCHLSYLSHIGKNRKMNGKKHDFIISE